MIAELHEVRGKYAPRFCNKTTLPEVYSLDNDRLPETPAAYAQFLIYVAIDIEEFLCLDDRRLSEAKNASRYHAKPQQTADLYFYCLNLTIDNLLKRFTEDFYTWRTPEPKFTVSHNKITVKDFSNYSNKGIKRLFHVISYLKTGTIEKDLLKIKFQGETAWTYHGIYIKTYKNDKLEITISEQDLKNRLLKIMENKQLGGEQ